MRYNLFIYLLLAVFIGLGIGWLIVYISGALVKVETPYTWSYNEYEASVAELVNKPR